MTGLIFVAHKKNAVSFSKKIPDGCVPNSIYLREYPYFLRSEDNLEQAATQLRLANSFFYRPETPSCLSNRFFTAH